MSERSLGDKWAAKLRAQGSWVLKLPASSTSGIPDWLVAGTGGVRLVEAKVRAQGRTAYRPSMVRLSQRFILGAIARHAGSSYASVLVLSEQGYVELAWSPTGGMRPLSAKAFERLRQSYA